jgi:hypothetical protein
VQQRQQQSAAAAVLLVWGSTGSFAMAEDYDLPERLVTEALLRDLKAGKVGCCAVAGTCSLLLLLLLVPTALHTATQLCWWLYFALGPLKSSKVCCIMSSALAASSLLAPIFCLDQRAATA